MSWLSLGILDAKEELERCIFGTLHGSHVEEACVI
jgi:hypothetical protein